MSNKELPDILGILKEFYPVMQPGIPFVEFLDKNYWGKLRELAKTDPKARQMAGMLVAPDKVTFYLGNTHVAIEYSGPTSVPKNLEAYQSTQVRFVDCRDDSDFLESIIGMKFKGGNILKLPLTPRVPVCNLFIPADPEAIHLMMDNGWDMTAEDMAFIMNTHGLELPANDFARMINCFFYATEQARLKTRRIQWIDFFPLKILETKETETTIEDELIISLWPSLEAVIEHDSMFSFPRPGTFENDRLALLNRFRELILEPDLTEPKITSWLAKPAHAFILKMGLPAKRLIHQHKFFWTTDPSRAPIIPDFLAVRANGYADIVEFKLPALKGATVVGASNREAFSAEIYSYIAQTRVYREYFQEKPHRIQVEESCGSRSITLTGCL